MPIYVGQTQWLEQLVLIHTWFGSGIHVLIEYESWNWSCVIEKDALKDSQAEWLKLFCLVVTTKVCILHVCIILTCYTPHHLIKLILYQAIIIDNFYIGSCSKNSTLLILCIQHTCRLCVSCSINISEILFYQHDSFTSPWPLDCHWMWRTCR